MKRLLLLVITFHISLFSFAQETVNLAGSWQLAIGDTAKYTDDVVLPGSMLTNGKGQ